MIRTWLPLALVCTLPLAGCGVDAVPLDARSTSTETVAGKLMEESPQVILIVADDQPSRLAYELRRRLTQGLRAGLMSIVDSRWGYCGSRDPAQWHPGDIRFVVARPSAPDTDTLLTWVQLPELAWVTNGSLPQEVDAVVAAMEEALSRRLAAPGELYRPLRASQRSLDLILGRRDAVGQAERAFADSLPEEPIVEVLMLTTRDDEDSLPVEELLLPPFDAFVRVRVMGPAAAPGYECQVNEFDAPRLEAWAALTGVWRLGWPCSEQAAWDHLITGWSADCGRRCTSGPILVRGDGAAACRVFIDHQGTEGCPASHGWRDPYGKVTYVDHYRTRYRRCEVVQLSGEHLNSCRHSLECPGCPSGFCVTELVEELWPYARCYGDGEPWPVRFIGGALDAEHAWIDMRCVTEGL